MKRFFIIYLFLLSCITSIAGVRFTTSNLNLRYGPGINHEIITTIPKGTPVTIDEDCDCKWIVVEYNGKIGYVSSDYLSKYYSESFSKHKQHKNLYYKKSNYPIRYYTNSRGIRVQSPTHYKSVPVGATALCRDGTYSFSRSRRGTCSHHGGVARWL